MRQTIDVPTLAALLGCSRSATYAALADGRLDLRVIRIGRRILIPLAEVERLLGRPVPSES